MSEVPPDRAGVGSGVTVTTRQAALAPGVAALGTLFRSVVPHQGMRDALVIALVVRPAGTMPARPLSLRMPRTVG